jgi:hypothetical protein
MTSNIMKTASSQGEAHTAPLQIPTTVALALTGATSGLSQQKT